MTEKSLIYSGSNTLMRDGGQAQKEETLDNLPRKDETGPPPHQSDKYWNRFKGNIRQTAERRVDLTRAVPNAQIPQDSRRDQKIKRSREGRWSWTFKLAPKRSWVGRWSWAAKVGLRSLRVVAQQQCNGHCPCDSAQHGS